MITSPTFTVLLISGSIAASNSPGLVEILQEKLGENVIAVLSSAALKFVSSDVLRYASQAAAVITDTSTPMSDLPDHVWLAEHMSGLLVYPASANFIGRLAGGLASDTASLTFLAGHEKPRMIAPAMNLLMWSNPVVQDNLSKLVRSGVRVVSPVDGVSPPVAAVAEQYCLFRGERTSDSAAATQS